MRFRQSIFGESPKHGCLNSFQAYFENTIDSVYQNVQCCFFLSSSISWGGVPDHSFLERFKALALCDFDVGF